MEAPFELRLQGVRTSRHRDLFPAGALLVAQHHESMMDSTGAALARGRMRAGTRHARGLRGGVDPANALPGYDDGAGGAIYKGLALAADASSQMRLFAADFHNNKIDGFDASFRKIALPNTAFVDPTLPTGHAPFNIQAIDLNGATPL
jgi:hypothetical protein